MPDLPTTADIAELLLQRTALLDLRAPVEFARGSLPGADNRPILDDAQRERVGRCHAEQGAEAATALGYSLATPALRAARLAAWRDWAERHPEGVLFCFRGGQRSRIAQDWLHQAGVSLPRLRGGYKAARRFLIDDLATACATAPLWLLAGATGTGKTRVIEQWPQSLDLEGRARHRGSAFGATGCPQPAQIDFENAIATDWLRRRALDPRPLLVEAESQLIGRLYLPDCLQRAMAAAPLVAIDEPLGSRIALLREDYVNHALAALQGESDPWAALQAQVSAGIGRIRRRLGEQRCRAMQARVPGAVAALRDGGDWGGFDQLIERLLVDYYDPLYAHKMASRGGRLLFRGERAAVLQWLAAQAR